MKLIILGDLHLREREPYDNPPIFSRLEEKLRRLKEVIDFTMIHGQGLILMGDTFDTKNPSEQLKHRFIQALVPLLSNNVPVWVIIGNHESNLHVHPLLSIKTLCGVQVDYPLHIIDTFSSQLFHGLLLHFLPHLSADKTLEAVASVKENDHPQILFAHTSLEGVTLENNYHIASELKPHHLEAFDLAFFGHIHKRQNGTQPIPWFFVGAAMPHSFGEASNEAGFTVLSIDDEASIEYIRLPSSTFYTATFTEENTIDDLPANIEPGYTVVKVIFKGSAEFLKSETVKEMQQQLTARQGTSYKKIMFDRLCTDQQVIEEEQPTEHLSDAIEEVVKKQQKPTSYIKAGVSLLQRAHDEIE